MRETKVRVAVREGEMRKYKVTVNVRERGDWAIINYYPNTNRGGDYYKIKLSEIPELLKEAMALTDLAGAKIETSYGFCHKFSSTYIGILYEGREETSQVDTGYALYMDQGLITKELVLYEPIEYEYIRHLIYEKVEHG